MWISAGKEKYRVLNTISKGSLLGEKGSLVREDFFEERVFKFGSAR